MNTRELYLRVLGTCEMGEGEFLLFLGDAVRSLLSLYPHALLLREGGTVLGAPASLNEETGLDPLYDGALIAAVVSAKTGDVEAKARFLREAEGAFREMWRRAAARRREAVRGDGK